MNLKLLPIEFSICKIKEVSLVDFNDTYVFVSKTDEEISLVCKTKNVPVQCLDCEHGWMGFKVEGQLDFSLIGIISKISEILARHKVGIFVISTFNTDYVLVKKQNLECAITALTENGYKFI